MRQMPQTHPDTTPVCGNSVIEADESCDDGNTVTETCDYGETSCEVCIRVHSSLVQHRIAAMGG